MIFIFLWVFCWAVGGNATIQTKEITQKTEDGSVDAGKVTVWTKTLDFQSQNDLMRIRLAIPKASDYEGKGDGFLQCTISNGKDSVAFAIPEKTNNGSLVFEASRFLLPPILNPNVNRRNAPQPQLLIVTVHTSLPSPVNYELGFAPLAESQFIIRPNNSGEWAMVNQKLSIGRPAAYVWNTKNVERAKISITSNDSLCGVLYLHNNHDSLFRRTSILTDLPSSAFRSISFSQRLDVTLDKSQLSNALYLYLLLQPDDSFCNPEAPPRIANLKKSFTITASVENISDFWRPLAAFVAAFLVAPVVLTIYAQRTPAKYEEEDSDRGSTPMIDLFSSSVNSVEEAVEGHHHHPPPPHHSDPVLLQFDPLIDPVPPPRIPSPSLQIPSPIPVDTSSSSLFDATFAVYILPALLLSCVQYNQSFASSRFEDTCYHNFGCAKRLGPFVAFNNIISNVGYIVNAVFYLVFVMIRSRRQNISRGPFPNHGLELSLGCALFCQGIASAIYHVCPNKFTFNFDTPFMQVISVIGMLKLYGNRHAVVCPHTANKFIGSIIACNVATTIFDQTLAMRAVVTAVQFVALAVSMGAISGGHKPGMDPKWALKSLRSSAFSCFVLAINAVVAAGHIFSFGMCQSNQFVTVLCILNMTLYIIYYLIMKVKAGEIINFLSIASTLASIGLWIAAIYFFRSEETNWTLTPSQSRNLNSDCLLFGFFDRHDIWHLFSAQAVLSALVALSTLDDVQRTHPRSDLAVF